MSTVRQSRCAPVIAKPSTAPSSLDSTLASTTPKDDDPNGEKLIAVADPLEQAHNLLKPLETESQCDLEVLRALFDVSLRRGIS
jgi:hypothetical protein